MLLIAPPQLRASRLCSGCNPVRPCCAQVAQSPMPKAMSCLSRRHFSVNAPIASRISSAISTAWRAGLSTGNGSGRIETRIGLRMMPTFPRSSLSFRTAGFPQYGWKAGLSDGAFLYVAQLKPAPGIRWSSSSLRPSFVHFVAHIDGTALSRACGLDCAPP